MVAVLCEPVQQLAESAAYAQQKITLDLEIDDLFGIEWGDVR